VGYSKPDDYAWTETPAPGGGGGGQAMEEWIDLPILAAGYSVFQATGWNLTNPTPDTLRVTSTITGTARNWTPSVQDGLVMILPQAVSPYPVEIPTGKSAQPWDSTRSILRVACRVTKGGPPYGASLGPRTIHGGPGWVSYTNDQAGAPAGPPWADTAPQPSWWVGAQMVDRNLGNNSWNPAWGSTGPGWYSTTPPDLPPYGDVGQANRVVISSGIGGFSPSDRTDESFCAQFLDDRTPAAALVYSTIESGRGWSPAYFKLNNKHVHPAFFVANYGTQIQIGDWFEFSQLRYLVQQTSSRGAE
jgi:hypothetical protein